MEVEETENQEVEMVEATGEERKIRKGVTRVLEIPANNTLRNQGPQMEIKRLRIKHPAIKCQIKSHLKMEMRDPMEMDQEEMVDQVMILIIFEKVFPVSLEKTILSMAPVSFANSIQGNVEVENDTLISCVNRIIIKSEPSKHCLH